MILSRTQHALDKEALRFIPTSYQLVRDGDVEFIVRIIDDLAGKTKGQIKKAPLEISAQGNTNPFLPYEQDLFVTELSDTHVCILNKFCILGHHILMITRAFERQDSPLTLQDFIAMWTCMTEFDGLAFYNSGISSGSSQYHKHLQMVPVPLAPRGLSIPIEPLLSSTVYRGNIGHCAELPFVHAISRIDSAELSSLQLTAEAALDRYSSMLDTLDMHREKDAGIRISTPYNLLVTRRWMLLIPRSREFFDSISINALGFAGALLVQNIQQLQALKTQGPMTVLKEVAIARRNSS
jgi:ATP adenylyltransferase